MTLEVHDLHVAYGRTQVLFGIDLEVPAGSVTCVMGRNGVGKTTLLNAVMGLLPLRRGRVCFEGDDLARLAPYQRARRGIAYVPQGHQVFPHMTVRENLQVVQERTRGGSDEGLAEALDLFPVLRTLFDRPAGLLSGGQAQQLAIARGLVTRPRLLVLDEPTEGIQPSIILEIENAIGELHRSSGMTILVVEQYVELALRLAHNYVVIDRGEVIDRGATQDIDQARLGDLLAV
ncbi:MAG TPA: urea ABC transporter ATP-binding subunit UrtE [Acidimicrobiales bacterium]|jgi:urea transport system ATP-binding protein|nr:urea ABC transporter ATP-binding subunit UrtE [Acidimicrobiales bacterium]